MLGANSLLLRGAAWALRAVKTDGGARASEADSGPTATNAPQDERSITTMRTTRTLMLSLLAAFAFSAVAAGAAQAVTGGPIWIDKSGALPKNITKVAGVSASQILSSSAVSMECETVGVKSGATNRIIGGNPGTDEATLVFIKCHVKGKTEAQCSVHSPGANTGEIVVAVKTLLGYKTKEAEPIYDQFFPAAETSEGKDLFVKLEFAGTKCETLEGKKINVTATGSEAPKPVGFGNRKCGVIAEVGYIETGVWHAAKSGVLYKLGGLKLPETALTEEETWNSETQKFVATTCKLEAGATAATQSGIASIELEGGEEFGIEI
jgi:hypothetical protein